MISIQTGGKDILDSKAFLAIGDGETIVTMGSGSEALKFILDFSSDEENKNDVKFIPIDNLTLKISLTNWNEPLGVALGELAEVGTFQHRKLYLLLNVKKVGSLSKFREVLITAYLGEGV